LTEFIGCQEPMPAGLFVVAAIARLTRVTQGERLFTLRHKQTLALQHHAE